MLSKVVCTTSLIALTSAIKLTAEVPGAPGTMTCGPRLPPNQLCPTVDYKLANFEQAYITAEAQQSLACNSGPILPAGANPNGLAVDVWCTKKTNAAANAKSAMEERATYVSQPGYVIGQSANGKAGSGNNFQKMVDANLAMNARLFAAAAQKAEDLANPNAYCVTQTRTDWCDALSDHCTEKCGGVYVLSKADQAAAIAKADQAAKDLANPNAYCRTMTRGPWCDAKESNCEGMCQGTWFLSKKDQTTASNAAAAAQAKITDAQAAAATVASAETICPNVPAKELAYVFWAAARLTMTPPGAIIDCAEMASRGNCNKYKRVGKLAKNHDLTMKNCEVTCKCVNDAPQYD